MRKNFVKHTGQHGILNKSCRLLWTLVWALFYRPSPRPFHAWRRLLLRLFGAKIAQNVHPYPSSKVWAPWNLEMDNHSCIGDHTNCYSVDKIRIGAYSTVSQYSFLCTASHDYTDPAMPLITAPIIIEASVWIAADVFVGPGVTVGEGSVVGARSTVFRNIQPWVVVGGNPVKVICQRRLSPGSMTYAAEEKS